METQHIKEEEMLDDQSVEISKHDKKVIVFTCNWNAYSALETAGLERLTYSSAVYPLKVMCLGQLSTGIILKAFEKGADGVLLLGCPPGECHFEFGNRRAEETFLEAKGLVALLGYQENQLMLDWVSAGEGKTFVRILEKFIHGLDRKPEE
jgi:coenzyme F420-reducing hydrogenase delta subunit